MKNTLKNNRKNLKLTTLGFTLIELLAVIVILGIIALITSSSISNIISYSKDESIKRSAEGIIKAAENYYYYQSIMSNEAVDKNINVLDGTLEFSGEAPSKGTVKFDDNGNINLKMYLNGYCIKKDYTDEATYKKTNSDNCEVYDTYIDGMTIYFDIIKGTSCNNYVGDNSKLGYNGINGTETQNSCLKFYAFNDNGGERLKLILDHNIVSPIVWNSSNISADGPSTNPDEFYGKLQSETAEWNGTLTPIGFEKGYKARAITAQEIAEIVGTDKLGFNENSSGGDSWFWFNGSGDKITDWQTQGSEKKFGWLYDRTANNCTKYGCYNNDPDLVVPGYWTSSDVYGTTEMVWLINGHGNLDYYLANSNNGPGLRPVIEIEKTSI